MSLSNYLRLKICRRSVHWISNISVISYAYNLSFVIISVISVVLWIIIFKTLCIRIISVSIFVSLINLKHKKLENYLTNCDHYVNCIHVEVKHLCKLFQRQNHCLSQTNPSDRSVPVPLVFASSTLATEPPKTKSRPSAAPKTHRLNRDDKMPESVPPFRRRNPVAHFRVSAVGR